MTSNLRGARRRDTVRACGSRHRTSTELFDLEWRLDEISQYVAWFAAEHTGTEDDRVAFGGLLHELTRP